MTSRKEAEDTLATLQQLNEVRGPNYEWSREEIAEVAPYYRGSPKRFNLPLYIQLYISRTPALREEASTSQSRENIIDEDPISLDAAVRIVFHAICPHPVRYYDRRGNVNFDEFNADLGIWLTMVSSIWMNMEDTQHDDQCKCCINFRMLATNYQEMFKQTMSKDEYLDKRVAKNAIRRWASGISSDGAKEGLASLVEIGKALLSSTDNQKISDLSDYSVNPSNIHDDEASNTTAVSEEYRREQRPDQGSRPDIDKLSPTDKERESASRPLNIISEIGDRDGVLTLAIPEIDKVVQVRIPQTSYTDVRRNEICKLAKIFFQQLIKVRAIMAVFKMRGRMKAMRRALKWDRARIRNLLQMQFSADEECDVYRPPSRKRQKSC